MTAKRLKKTPPVIPATREEMETLVGEIAALTITRDEHMVDLDGRIQNIRAEYEGTLAEIRIQLDEKLESARLWAETNPEAFGKAKSIEMVHGTIGFRTGMPKLKTLRGRTWEVILQTLNLMGLQQYVRQKQEVDKDRILADRDQLADSLPRIGVEVVQEETFFVEPKREESAS